MWIVGIDCRDGKKIALPAVNVMLHLDLSVYFEQVENDMKSVRSGMAKSSQATHYQVPPFIQNMFGPDNVKGMEIPQEAKDQAAVAAGNSLESLINYKQAEIVAEYDGDLIPMRSFHYVTTWDKLMKERVV